MWQLFKNYTFIIFLLIFILLNCHNITKAQETSSETIIEQTDNQSVVKNWFNQINIFTQDIFNKLKTSGKQFLQKKQNEFGQAIKAEIKKEAKEKGERLTSSVKESWLNPLKQKIQKGSAIIRNVIRQAKERIRRFVLNNFWL